MIPLRTECVLIVKVLEAYDRAPMFDRKFYYAEIPFDKGLPLVNVTANGLDEGKISYKIFDRFGKFEVRFNKTNKGGTIKED